MISEVPYHFVLEISPTVLANGSTQLFMFCSPATGFRTKPTDSPPNTKVKPVVLNAGAVRRSLFNGGRITGSIKPDYGQVILSNADGSLDTFAGYALSGAKIVCYWGPEGAAYPTGYTIAYTAYGRDAEVDLDQITINVRDRLQLFDVPVLDKAFQGTGDLEGYGSVPKKRQFISEDPFFVVPTLIDVNRQIYHLMTSGVSPGFASNWLLNPLAEVNLFDVFDQGIKLDRVDPDYPSETSLLAGAPGEGEVRYYFGTASTYLAGGYSGDVYFRLGSPPVSGGDVRVYAHGVPTDADHARWGSPLGSFIFAHAALRLGISRADVSNATNAIGPAFIDDDTTWLTLLDKSCESINGWHGFNRFDQYRSGYLLDPEDDDPHYGINPSVVVPTVRTTTSLHTFKVSTDSDGPNVTHIIAGTLKRSAVPGMQVPIKDVFVQATKTYPCPTANGATPLLKDYLSRDPWKEVFQGVSDTAKLANPGADSLKLELIHNATFPNAFSKRLYLERLFVLFGGDRHLWTFKVQMTSALLALDLMDVVTLKIPRFSLSSGKKYRIVGVEFDCDPRGTPTMTFTLWGGTIGSYTGTISETQPPAVPSIRDGIQQLLPVISFAYGLVTRAGGYGVQTLPLPAVTGTATITAAPPPAPSTTTIDFNGLPGDYTTVIAEQYATPEGVHFTSDVTSSLVSADVSLQDSPEGSPAAFVFNDGINTATITVASDTPFVTPLDLEINGASGGTGHTDAGLIEIYSSSNTLLNPGGLDRLVYGGFAGPSGGWTELSITFAGTAAYFKIINNAGTFLAFDNIVFTH